MSRTLEGAMKKERLLGVVDVFRQIYRDIPSRYYPLVADRVTQCAFALVRIWQDFDAGKQTLKFAYHLTSPSRRGVPPRYQSLARLVGVRGAFIIAFVYGKISSALKTNRRSSSSAQ